MPENLVEQARERMGTARCALPFYCIGELLRDLSLAVRVQMLEIDLLRCFELVCLHGAHGRAREPLGESGDRCGLFLSVQVSGWSAGLVPGGLCPASIVLCRCGSQQPVWRARWK